MDDLTDFLSQMAILVREEAPLYEIPQARRLLLQPPRDTPAKG